MITKVEVYTSAPAVATLPLSASVYAGADYIQVKSIDGVDPVNASVNTSPLAAVDGEMHVGDSVSNRNIVLTLNPNPDWTTWTHEKLRQFIYSYFTPKSSIRLVFTTDELDPVEIFGIVESIAANQFAKDPEFSVSIICPDPYFTAVEPVEVSGTVNDGIADVIEITNLGNIACGIYLKITQVTTPNPTFFKVLFGLLPDALSYFLVDAAVGATLYFDMDSRPRHKFVREVDTSSAVITNRMIGIHDGSLWPVLTPNVSKFGVMSDTPENQAWTLTYFERYGGL